MPQLNHGIKNWQQLPETSVVSAPYAHVPATISPITVCLWTVTAAAMLYRRATESFQNTVYTAVSCAHRSPFVEPQAPHPTTHHHPPPLRALRRAFLLKVT